jgi:hypothetical protein
MSTLKFNIFLIITFVCLFIFFPGLLISQTPWCVNSGSAPYGCSTLEMIDFPAIQAQKDFVFDSFSEWKSGITINGGTVIKVIATQNSTGGAPTCVWKLKMRINNETATGNEWETLTTYGSASSGNKPTVGMLQVRVNNGCNTPKNAGVWQTFSGDLAELDIINPVVPLSSPPNYVPADGTALCSGGQTNGAGSYLSSEYNEFVFTIDYRIVPNVNTNLIPGRYEVKIDFCISQ